MRRLYSHTDDLPLYKHVSLLLADDIIKQHKPGDVLPQENDLARRYRVNRQTLRRAMQELVSEGLIDTVQGKGMVVHQRIVNYAILEDAGFSNSMESDGREVESVVLRKVGIPAQGDLVRSLGVEPDEPLALIETLRLLDNVPVSVVTHYLPLEKVFDVIRTFNGGSLHDFLNNNYDIRVRRVESWIQAVLPDQQVMKRLSIDGYTPILLVKSINVEEKSGKPIELVLAHFKGGATKITVGS